MNRILFEPSEVTDGIVTFGGERAAHVVEVLHGEVGQTLKTGILDGPVGTSEIVSVEAASGEFRVTARCTHGSRSLEPWCDVILAPPRPRVMKRLLPQLAALGVGHLALVGAEKVERDFWGATLLKPENLRPLLVDGLMQAGTTVVPTVSLHKSFRRYMREAVESDCAHAAARVVAHPYGASTAVPAAAGDGRLVLAIGPEGGWTDAEVALLEDRGFVRYALGRRILRTDTAAVALLARMSEWFDR